MEIPSHILFFQTLGFFFASFLGIIFSKKYRNPYISIILFFPVLYTWGKVMQIYLIGPSWVRWYVSDFGFVGFGTLLALIYTNPLRQKKFKALAKKMMRLTIIMFMIAIMVELMQMEADKISREKNLLLQTAGDPIDVALYIYSFLFNVWLIIKAALYEQRLFVFSSFFKFIQRYDIS